MNKQHEPVSRKVPVASQRRELLQWILKNEADRHRVAKVSAAQARNDVPAGTTAS